VAVRVLVIEDDQETAGPPVIWPVALLEVAQLPVDHHGL